MRALSRASMVAPGTVARVEHGGSTNMRTLDDLRRAFARAGVKFGAAGKIEIKKA